MQQLTYQVRKESYESVKDKIPTEDSRVLGAIRAYIIMNKHNVTDKQDLRYPTAYDIVDATGLDRNNVRRSLTNLKDAGEVVPAGKRRERKGKMNTTWEINQMELF